MKFYFTRPFKKDYKKLAKEIQKESDKKLQVLLQNPKHPSLRVKKIKSAPGIFEATITKNYWLTFQIEGNNYILRRIGTHNILKSP